MTASNQPVCRFGRMAGQLHRRRGPIALRRSAARRMRPTLDLLEERRLLATTFMVNSLLDQVDNSPTTTVTLRDAIDNATADGGGTIEFASDLATESAGYGNGVIALSIVGDNTFGPSALAVQPGLNITIAGPPGNAGITIERAPSAGHAIVRRPIEWDQRRQLDARKPDARERIRTGGQRR